VFLQNSKIPAIFGIFGIIFLKKKICRICPHHRGPGPPARAHGGASRSSAAAHRSSSFLLLRWSVLDEVCSYGISQRRGERVCANLNRRRAATEPGNDEAARSVLVDGEGGLR
jgi:hypothetical protein